MPETEQSLVKQVSAAAQKLASNKAMTLKELLGIVAPEAELLPVPEKLPVPAVITQEQKVALENLTKQFGSVVPTERRVLTPAETKSLLDERMTCDEVEKMAAARKENIRTTIFNHFDVEAESADRVNGQTPRDKDGHYVLEGKAPVPETDKDFKRELREAAPSLNVAALEALADDPDSGFTRKDFLSMTTQTRVFDESKAMEVLKKNPKLVLAVAKATNPGGKTAALYVRKRK